jgi:hypothetical protein
MRVVIKAFASALLLSAGVLSAGPVDAHAPSGAIFTTLPDGSEVNFNHYPDKESVYLDGGPGPGAPQTAAGLDDGTYVFQVTNPSGRVLLSTDPAGCRQFTVSNGVITGVVATGCQHLTGTDIDHGAVTVQLMPYLDTPNPGGVYKAWATTVGDYLLGCTALGVPNGLEVVDCGFKAGVAEHGFIPSHSKTDNFKVGDEVIVEIDTRFHSESGALLDGQSVTWTDTLGGKNKKWSYWAPQLSVFHEAHVEAVETGQHTISVDNQSGCAVQDVYLDGAFIGHGPQSVAVQVKTLAKTRTYFVDVWCQN